LLAEFGMERGKKSRGKAKQAREERGNGERVKGK
jgi:hypothetical protein